MANKKTIFYNTYSEETIGIIRNQYTVDGKTTDENPDLLPENVIELEVVYQPYPTIDNTKVVNGTWEVNLENKKYVRIWNVRDKTEYELAMEDWHHNNFNKRIKAPASYDFISGYISIKIWFDLNNLPIVKEGDFLYCYCSEILEEHQEMIDSLEGIIIIEDKPKPEDFVEGGEE